MSKAIKVENNQAGSTSSSYQKRPSACAILTGSPCQGAEPGGESSDSLERSARGRFQSYAWDHHQPLHATQVQEGAGVSA
jgi:hypothetical protein